MSATGHLRPVRCARHTLRQQLAGIGALIYTMSCVHTAPVSAVQSTPRLSPKVFLRPSIVARSAKALPPPESPIKRATTTWASNLYCQPRSCAPKHTHDKSPKVVSELRGLSIYTVVLQDVVTPKVSREWKGFLSFTTLLRRPVRLGDSVWAPRVSQSSTYIMSTHLICSCP